MRKKTLIALIAILSMAIPLTACHNDSPDTEDTESSDVSTEESTDTTSESEESSITSEDTRVPDWEDPEKIDPNEKYKDNEAYQAALNFFTTLKNNDVDAAMDWIALYDNSVIKKTDLEKILLESEWAPLIGVKEEFRLISFDQRYEDRKYLTFKIGEDQYNIPVALDYDGKWRVSFTKYIIENFEFVVPWEVKVYWDGMQLDPNKYATVISTGNTLLHKYVVTCTPTEVEFKFHSSAFGDFIRHITPRYLSDPYELNRSFDSSQRTAVLEGIKDMWNDMFYDYLWGMTPEEWTYKHFAYRMEQDERMDIYSQFKEFLGDNNYSKVEIIDIKPWDDYFTGISMNRVATANFTYKIRMEIKQSDGSIKEVISDTLKSNIRVEKADGYYIIFEVTDPELFTNNTPPLYDDFDADEFIDADDDVLDSIVDDNAEEIPSSEVPDETDPSMPQITGDWIITEMNEVETSKINFTFKDGKFTSDKNVAYVAISTDDNSYKYKWNGEKFVVEVDGTKYTLLPDIKDSNTMILTCTKTNNDGERKTVDYTCVKK